MAELEWNQKWREDCISTWNLPKFSAKPIFRLLMIHPADNLFGGRMGRKKLIAGLLPHVLQLQAGIVQTRDAGAP